MNDADEPAVEPPVTDPHPRRGAARRRLGLLLDPASPALTVAGLLLVAAGFVLIAVGWFDVSGVADVALQMPYVASAALTGLGLIVIGAASVAVAAKRQESDQRVRKLEALEGLMRELSVALARQQTARTVRTAGATRTAGRR